MACIHCAFVQGNLPALVVPALLGRHLAIGLGLASEGIVLGKCSGWFLCDMGEPGKPTSLVNTVIFNWYSFRMMFFCQWNSFKPWVAGLLLLSTATVQFSFRRFKLCADIIIAYLQQGHRHQQFLPVLIWGMGCRDPWRTLGVIPSLGFHLHHMLLTS